jgi:hypothetical protein
MQASNRDTKNHDCENVRGADEVNPHWENTQTLNLAASKHMTDQFVRSISQDRQLNILLYETCNDWDFVQSSSIRRNETARLFSMYGYDLMICFL